MSNNLLLYGSRIVLPVALQKEALVKIHQGHQGVQRCYLRAMNSVWWPKISREIKEIVSKCQVCIEHCATHPEPMIAPSLLDRPWQKIASDLFILDGATYLLVVDYFSRYPEIFKLRITTSGDVISALRSIFSRHGVPEVMVSDNGPQYSSQEMKEFAST